MSNTSTVIVSTDLIRASMVLPIMDRYIFVLLYIFGLIGSLLNIFIFLQKRLRIKSCSIYFLANSIVDFCYINSFILIQLISLFNNEIAMVISSANLWCKLGNYFYFLLPCLASTYITFASIDRFCVSSLNETLQKVNQLKISYLLALLIVFIWSVFSLHIPISYNRIQSTPTRPIQCNPQLDIVIVFIIIDGYFFALFNGIVVPILLILFGLLIFRNVKLIHHRILPQPLSITISTHNHQTNRSLTRGNQHLITMLLFQVSLTIFLYIPYIVLYLYGIYNSRPTDDLLLLIYEIFSYIARWFWSMNFCKTFYVNILSSQTYRTILQRRFTQLVMSNHQPQETHSSDSDSTENSN